MNTSVKITILVDNEAPEELAKEHGFSAWIETDGRHILFDTGQLGALQTNAERLGINLAKADILVLSHGHYDHTGTLPEFLKVNNHAHIWCVSNVAIPRFSCKPGTEPRFIGMPDASKEALAQISAGRIHEIGTPRYLSNRVGITGPVPRESIVEDTGGPFFLDDQRGKDDMLEDDQSMWFETDQGLVILLGCCHAGLVNTVEYIKTISGIDKIHGIIGGMHLVNADEARLKFTFDHMKSWKPDFLAPCHCTGTDASGKMVEALGSDIVSPGRAGLIIEA